MVRGKSYEPLNTGDDDSSVAATIRETPRPTSIRSEEPESPTYNATFTEKTTTRMHVSYIPYFVQCD